MRVAKAGLEEGSALIGIMIEASAGETIAHAATQGDEAITAPKA